MALKWEKIGDDERLMLGRFELYVSVLNSYKIIRVTVMSSDGEIRASGGTIIMERTLMDVDGAKRLVFKRLVDLFGPVMKTVIAESGNPWTM